ncbi:MAG: PKD domain-containing protein [Nanoarchaeota archaeon]|mgnify:CR=1 FL=1
MSSIVLDPLRTSIFLAVMILLSVLTGFVVLGQDFIEEISDLVPNEISIEENSEETINPFLEEVTEETSENNETLENAEIPQAYSENPEQENSSENISQIQENKSEELIPYTKTKNGLMEIETLIERDSDISITKEESIESSSEDSLIKSLTVSSDIHFNRPLRVYTNIPEIEDVEQVHLYWTNSNQEEEDRIDDPSFEVEFHDENSNGMYERISFIVPHLSDQSFRIIINFTTSSNSSSLILNRISAPSGTINSIQELNFQYSLDYAHLNDILCNFSISNSEREIYGLIAHPHNESLTISSTNLSNGIYSWTLECYDSVNGSINSSLSETFSVNLDYSLTVNFTTSSDTIIMGQNVPFQLNLNSLDNRSIYYTIFFGDGSSLGPVFDRNINRLITHNYTLAGTYNASISVIDGLSLITKSLTINVLTLSNLSSNNSSPISLSLISPADDSSISTTSINFTYLPTGNVSNCSFNLYYYNSSQIGERVYSLVNKTVISGVVSIVNLISFDEGDYSWEVECRAINNSMVSKTRDFEYFSSNSNQTQSRLFQNKTFEGDSKIRDLLDRIESFLGYEGYSREEQEAIEILGINKEMIFYQKKLGQIKQDLQNDIQFITDAKRREERRLELYEELENISRSIPNSIEVSDSGDFVKNRVDSSIEEVIDKYISAKNLELSRGERKRMIEHTEELQENLRVSTRYLKISLEYKDEEKQLTLIVKTLQNADDSSFEVLEVISQIAQGESLMVMIPNEIVISKEMFLIKSEDLEDNKLVYNINGHLSQENIKKIDSLLFEEKISSSSNRVTGFTILGSFNSFGGISIIFGWFIVITLLMTGGIYSYKERKYGKYAEHSQIKEIIRLIQRSKSFIASGDIESAKSIYPHMAEIYSRVPRGAKAMIYEKINSFCRDLAYYEALLLIKDYSDLIKEGMNEQAHEVYRRIQELYLSISEENKPRIYEQLKRFV